jgi:DNA-binding PadR family transcriptional regulator
MRYPFLALLSRAPAHGYELKQAFDQAFGSIWPELNFGQVYTTLARLERDGLVQGEEIAQEHRRDKKVYEVTTDGLAALQAWIEEPQEGAWIKDEFFMRVAMARLTGIADPQDLIERQRRRYLQDLHELNAAMAPHLGVNAAVRHAPQGDIIASLYMEGAALHLEADLKWLDACERAFAADAERIPAERL